MNYTDKAYVDLIANGINQCEYKVDFSQVSLDRLMRLCANHRTIGLAYAGMKMAENIPDDYREIFETGLNMEVVEYVNNKECIKKIANCLKAKSIKHLIVKGITIAQLYPQEELRKAGDIDLLIAPEDKEKVRKALIELGAIYHYANSDEHVDFYKMGRDVIEVHSKIVSGVNFSNDDIYENFSQRAYENAININDFTYKMNGIDAYAYAVFHAAKHFYKGGCGLRMIVDVWLMRKSLDDKQLSETIDLIERMGLKPFETKLFRLAQKWFEDRTIHIDDFEIIENYVIVGGLFGYGNVGNDTSQIRKTNQDNYLLSVIKWAFPGYKYMRNHSEWFKDKPSFLLPVAYAVRFYNKIKSRGGRKLVKNIAKGKREADRHEVMLKIMGLNNE